MLVNCNAFYCELCIDFMVSRRGAVVLPCHHHKHVSFTVFLSLLYRIGKMFFKH